MPRLLLIATLVLGIPILLQGQQKVPELHGSTLSGATVDFPKDLQGHTSVLIVSFSQGARDTVTGWFRRLSDDYRTSATVLYYALPDLSGAPGFLRGTIAKKIKETVAEPVQPRFVPIMNRDEAWKTATGFTKQAPEDQAWVLLVDGTGTVRAHFAVGPVTDRSYADLQKQLAAIR